MKCIFRSICIVAAEMVFVITGCDYSYEVQPLEVDGTYSAQTADGQPIVLALRSSRDGLSGQGTLDGSPVVFVQGGPTRIEGRLILSDGATLPATLEFSGKERLLLEFGSETLVMEAGGMVTPLPDGPFTGHYVTQDLQSLLETVSLKQSGEVVSGSGIALGERVTISGWLTAPDGFNGHVILPDGTEVEIKAALDPDNDLTVRGLGKPVVFERQ